MKHAALLRGINVGGKNMLPMKRLVEMFVAEGCRDVVTYIQSGNIVFSASSSVLKKVPSAIPKRIEAEFGFRVPVILRSHEELDTAIRLNPFVATNSDEKLHYVAYLSDTPDEAAIAKLDPNRSPSDLFAVIGREVHLCLHTGAAKTKITNAWLDSKLATVSTVRNWATTLKLREMTRG